MKPPTVVVLMFLSFLGGFCAAMQVFRHQADAPPSLGDLWDRVRAIESAEELDWRVKRLESRIKKGEPPADWMKPR